MFTAAAASIVVALALVIIRAIKGPTVFDRVLAGNSVGSLAIMLLAVVGFLTARPEFFDGSGHEQPPRTAAECVRGLDKQHFERIGQVHCDVSSTPEFWSV